MGKRFVSQAVALLLIMTFPVYAAPADSVVFRTDTLSASNSESVQCVQVGIYAIYLGPTARRWSIVNTTLNYQATDGVLAGAPVVRLADFSSGEAGLAIPAIPLVNHAAERSPCSSVAVENRATLKAGPEIRFASGSGSAAHSEFLNPETGRIQLHASSNGTLFQTEPGKELLLAIISFPISAGASGTVLVNFVPEDVVLDGNKLVDQIQEDLTASTENGAIHLRSSGLGLAGWALLCFVGGMGLSLLPKLRFLEVFPKGQ